MTVKKQLKEIIAAGFEGTQQEIRDEIVRRGTSVNQSSVSRALKNLKAKKVNGKWVIADAKQAASSMMSIADHVTKLSRNESLIVIRTVPGSAHYVGSYLDFRKDETILGTVAGDDTIMVIPSSVKKIETTMTRLEDYLGL